MYIRFVGGSFDNKFKDIVNPFPKEIQVANPEPLLITKNYDPSKITFNHEKYRLAVFISSFGTRFYEYCHESLNAEDIFNRGDLSFEPEFANLLKIKLCD